MAVFFSNPIKNKSNDVDFEFHQDPDFFYLTGLNEPDATLLVFKEEIDFEGRNVKEIIFLREKKASSEIWTGKQMGRAAAVKFLGLDAASGSINYKDFIIDTSEIKKVLFSRIPEDVVNDVTDDGDLYNLISISNNKFSGINKDNKLLPDLMAELRQVKTSEELVHLEKAIQITCNAQLEVMRSLDTNMTEFQAEALAEYVFHDSGAEKPGFPSIIGGGENSCILHYVSNRKPLKSRDLLVVDIGAEYHNYTADVTRTIPVDGKYSTEERFIYNIVLEAQTAGINAAKPGGNFWDPHNAAQAVIQKRLMEAGIINNQSELRKYFMHGTSHYLGLDVHDVGLYGKLTPGNVITVEPGIYIAEGSECDPKWWNIGVRIEDDILITPTGNRNLSDCVPRLPDEIEEIMKQPGIRTKK